MDISLTCLAQSQLAVCEESQSSSHHGRSYTNLASHLVENKLFWLIF